MRWQFWIDVGGTFTDCVARTPAGQLVQWKTLSSGRIKGAIESAEGHRLYDPRRCQPRPDFWAGWTFQLLDRRGEPCWSTTVVSSTPQGELLLSQPLPADLSSDGYELDCGEEAPLICVRSLLQLRLEEAIPDLEMRLGTTRGTNALLERKGARTAFLTTKGFADILQIGNQDRPDLFALEIVKQQPLTETVVEIEERLGAEGQVLQPMDPAAVRRQLQRLAEQQIESLAICLLHAYRNPVHELQIEELAREAGFRYVSRSSLVAPVIKLVQRGETTLLDAYLTPVLRNYLDGIREKLGAGSSLKVMTSHGGLVDSTEFSGKDSILSGPAGGVIAFSTIAQQAGFTRSIGFDMGGTSTDVSRFDGRYELDRETQTAGVRIAVPQLAIETVAAGGGSLCTFDGLQLRVGPASAGADPGPACYGRGGPLTVTDMNLILGRLLPELSPFPLDADFVRLRLKWLCELIAASPLEKEYSLEELAQGFIDIANEAMVRAIRQISVRKGYDPADHLLVCFGGAGGQHACALARALGIRKILVHPYSGVLSALGMGLADVRRRGEVSVLQELTPATLRELEPTFRQLEQELVSAVTREGIAAADIEVPQRSLALRYRGVEGTIVIESPADGDYQAEFERRHQQLYGYRQSHRALEIVTATVEVIGRLPRPEIPPLTADASPEAPRQTRTWFNGRSLETTVLEREQLRAGQQLTGPTLVCGGGATLWIEPGYRATIGRCGELLIEWEEAVAANDVDMTQYTQSQDAAAPADPVLLEIYNNQFASIAEQMGVTLRKTSRSTNVKERLDYSCALFDAQGGLVVNAPHIPVHLGAMGETVRCLLRDRPTLHPGDVYVTNDPYAGGSHLPDLTVITPVHDAASGELLFLTASRAHHAEIGGITPGSMPPFSTTLGQEGVLIQNFLLADRGHVRLSEFRQLLTSGPYPSRSPDDNIADVTAQVAANQLGARLLLEMVANAGRSQVQQYMQHIQAAAERKMRRALSRLADGRYERTDFLDDGSPIRAVITITGDEAGIDFEGTGPVLRTNLNANRAIVTAAVMYVFRCLIDEAIPLNCGVLRPLTIQLPECLLNPPVNPDRAQCAAVVGGNVETSQRIVDVLLGGLGLAAASQGTMNNLTFGDETFGYYETICGGAGATDHAAGADAVHTHMTNTRLTDVEVLEHRYPAHIEEFSIRRGSGGVGRHSGGAGIRRVFRFLKPLRVSLLTQRRGPYPPFGLEGGAAGAVGRNLLQRRGSDFWEELANAVAIDVEAGDRLILETPGGGGFGVPENS
ncbi:hydantoinase B/oxoprolinase family protein [Planctomicrobium sp. SH664]|uniref:hydantoinase B/oxoprolinase family protein n=1 Tax=Planctomicrobium sp. SH664 TaxID=3448125 RepID=UPI003F5BC5D5